jgi:hypothetical protein
MGWNDRVPDEPPYIPYERAEDRDAYDNWQLYLDYCRSELEEHTGGLSSQNVEPGAEPLRKRQLMPSVRRLFHALKELISK